MKKNGSIVSFTSEEIAEMVARGESKSDWARADAMTDADIAAAIASDPDEANIVWDDNWVAGTPPAPGKQAISLRLDPDILDFFRAGGPGYQTRINAVLRTYMQNAGKKAS
jgi:uncharacterized protein (DUF4415 family)